MNNIEHWLAAVHTNGFGFATYEKLSRQLGGIEGIFKAPHAQLKSLKVPDTIIASIKKPPVEKIQNAIAWLKATSHHFIHLEDDRYPSQLKEIARPPLALFIIGDANLLLRPQLAMVGSRNPTPQGEQLARMYARQLSEKIIITSGLALGVDGASHTGALESKQKTIAVLGTGVNICYPRSHQTLYEKIGKQGALVSEFPLGTTAAAQHFPMRNRIISGLSQAVFVVEATVRSGSLITARLAAEQGRDVFALPGSVNNTLARGCLKLIQDGAKCITHVDDILQELRLEISSSTKTKQQDKLPNHPLLRYFDDHPIDIDNLIDKTGLDFASVCSMLLHLECQGLITSTPGGYIKR
ncbi:MAG: DNA-processing protein DprA [Gammaproteobacteria bacterium]